MIDSEIYFGSAATSQSARDPFSVTISDPFADPDRNGRESGFLHNAILVDLPWPTASIEYLAEGPGCLWLMAYAQKGLKGIIQKHPSDVVILSALRTPITRAYKGGLRNAYPEQMLAAVCFANVDKLLRSPFETRFRPLTTHRLRY